MVDRLRRWRRHGDFSVFSWVGFVASLRTFCLNHVDSLNQNLDNNYPFQGAKSILISCEPELLEVLLRWAVQQGIAVIPFGAYGFFVSCG